MLGVAHRRLPHGARPWGWRIHWAGLFGVLLVMGACSDEKPPMEEPPPTCIQICASRSSSCDIPSVLSTPGCRDLCRAEVSDTQLECLMSARCPELEGAFEVGAVCDIQRAQDAGQALDTGPAECVPPGSPCVTVGMGCCTTAMTVPFCDPARGVCCLQEGSACSADSECCNPDHRCTILAGNSMRRCNDGRPPED